MAERNTVDMTQGPLLGKILRFALPFAASGIMQQLFVTIDVAVVGRFATSEALAAVGANTFLINLLINLLWVFPLVPMPSSPTSSDATTAIVFATR